MDFPESVPGPGGNDLAPGASVVHTSLYRFGPGLAVVWLGRTVLDGYAFQVTVPDLRGPHFQFHVDNLDSLSIWLRQWSLSEYLPLLELRGKLYGEAVLEARLASERGFRGAAPPMLREEAVAHPITDRVSFSLTGPRKMVPGRLYVLEAWAHLDGHRKEVIRRAGETQGARKVSIVTKVGVLLSRGTTITVRLWIPDLIVPDPKDTIIWDGEIANSTFILSVPRDTPPRQYDGTATFSVGGIRVAKLHFILEVGEEEAPPGEIKSLEARIRSAFASYASEDRDDVLGRVQGIKKVLPDLDLFLDVLSLRSGQDWAERLLAEIRWRDVFYLFWSLAASRSVWVEKEWRAALEHRGLDFINPVPLVPPRVAPPPKELVSLHFNDPEVEFLDRRKANRAGEDG
jgi:hypothetical protein